MIQPKVSFHLSVLKEAGLIKDRKQGKWIHYCIDDTDIFRRFLVLSVLERISESLIQEDNKRLKEFLKTKKVKGEIIALKVKQACFESESLSKEVKHG
jgi:ArsR family transcriptional regulator